MQAKYTEYLKDLLNNENSKQAIEKALSTYPLYEPKKEYDLIPTREELNKKLLNHYKYREIAFETVGRFIDDLEITMNEIMPYYNEMFKTVEIMADLENPFDNVDVTESFKETRKDTTSTQANTTAETTANSTAEGTSSQTTSNNDSGTSSQGKETKFSDTPQNNITNIDNYMTTYTKEDTENNYSNNSNGTLSGEDTNESNSNSESSSSTEGTSEAEGTTEHTYTKKGNQGVNTYAHDMNEFRTSIIDVVDKIINDKRIQELFLLVY